MLDQKVYTVYTVYKQWEHYTADHECVDSLTSSSPEINSNNQDSFVLLVINSLIVKFHESVSSVQTGSLHSGRSCSSNKTDFVSYYFILISTLLSVFFSVLTGPFCYTVALNVTISSSYSPVKRLFGEFFFYLKRPCGVRSWFPVGGI